MAALEPNEFERRVQEREQERDRCRSESITKVRRAKAAVEAGTATPEDLQIVQNADRSDRQRIQEVRQRSVI